MIDNKIKIMFVCHGNICRSPMAEFLFKYYVGLIGECDRFVVSSSATTTEEIGNPVHYGTAKILDKFGIDYSKKRAVLLKQSDYSLYDYFIGMDNENVRDMQRLFSGDKDNKVFSLTDFNGGGEIADPWWTGNFNATFLDIDEGVKKLYEYLTKKPLIL